MGVLFVNCAQYTIGAYMASDNLNNFVIKDIQIVWTFKSRQTFFHNKNFLSIPLSDQNVLSNSGTIS